MLHNMKEKIISYVFIAIFLVGFLICGLLLSVLNISVFGFDLAVIIWLIIFAGSIWLSRKDKDGIVMLFKDIHQSNLDDIEEQELVERGIEQ